MSTKFEHVLSECRLKILSGEWGTGTYIPSENQLVQHYGISRPTIRKALNGLIDEGLIVTIPGKGSVVQDITHLNVRVVVLRLFWHTPSNELPIVRRIVERFNSEHEHIKVTIVESAHVLPIARAHDTPFAHAPADLYSISNRSLIELYADEPFNWLKDVTHLMKQHEERTYHFLWKGLKLAERAFAVPLTFSPIMLAYNKRLFDEAGLEYPHASWNWDQLVEAAKRLTNKETNATIQYGIGFSNSFYRWPLFYIQQGGTFSFDRGNAEHMQDTAVPGEKGIQFILDLIYANQVMPSFSRDLHDVVEELFDREKLAMILTTFYCKPDQLPKSFPWEMTKPPSGSVDASLAISTSIGIAKDTEHAYEAELFIRYLLSDSIQAMIKHEGTTIPAAKMIAENEQFPHHPYMNGYSSFRSTLHDIHMVSDLGLTKQQIDELNYGMELVWSRIETFRSVWSLLQSGTLRSSWWKGKP